MDTIKFKIKGAYTMVFISDAVAMTFREEITITDLDKKRGRYLYKKKGNKKLYYLPKPEELDDRMFFSGHNLPFTLDTETDRCMGNAKFNFVTDEPDALREFIKANCLNPSEEKFSEIYFTSTDRRGSGEIEGQKLFTQPQS